jgi:hypothetical protein
MIGDLEKADRPQRRVRRAPLGTRERPIRGRELVGLPEHVGVRKKVERRLSAVAGDLRPILSAGSFTLREPQRHAVAEQRVAIVRSPPVTHRRTRALFDVHSRDPRKELGAQIVYAIEIKRLDESPESRGHGIARLTAATTIWSRVGSPDEHREILPLASLGIGHLLERGRERRIGARIVAELLRGVSGEREAPAGGRRNRAASGALESEAVRAERTSGFHEIAHALAENPSIAGKQRAEAVERHEQPRSRRDDGWRLGRW